MIFYVSLRAVCHCL